MNSNNYDIIILLLLVNIFCLTDQSPIIRFPVEIKNKKGESKWLVNVGDDGSCIPLKECSTFTWMLEYENIQNEVVQIRPIEVATLIRSKKCALDEVGSDTMVTIDTRVTCPHKVEENDDYGDYYNYVAIRDDYDEDECYGDNGMDIEAGLGTKMAREMPQCELEFIHGPFEDILASLQTTQFGGQRKEYQTLKNLELRKVLHIEAHGNCCWEIYQRPHFKGDIHHVEPGNSVYPVHQPRSVKRVCC